MSHSLRRGWIVVAVLFVLLAVPARWGEANGGGGSRSDPFERQEGQCAHRLKAKLKRGVINIATGWLEVPRTVIRSFRKRDYFVAIVVSPAEGVGWAVARTASGAFDVVTCAFATTEGDTGLIQPETLLPPRWGEALPPLEPIQPGR